MEVPLIRPGDPVMPGPIDLQTCTERLLSVNQVSTKAHSMRVVTRSHAKRTAGRHAWHVPLAVFALVGALLACVVAPALALSEGRMYEMVTPPYKGGYGVGAGNSIEAVSQDGERVMFYSPGSFAGAPSGAALGPIYAASRTASRWETTPEMAPAGLLPYTVGEDVSPNLSSVLVLGKPGANQEGAFQTGTEAEFMVHSTEAPDTGAGWELAGPVLRTFPEEVIGVVYRGASSDFCHIVVEPAPIAGGDSPFLPGEAGQAPFRIYEVDRGCGGEPAALRQVAMNNQGSAINPTCQTQIGVENSGSSELKSSFNAVADGGREIFFTAPTGSCEPSSDQVFVRLGGARTLEVSRPLDVSESFGGCVGEGEVPGEVPCEDAGARSPADFVGASEDGSRVFFTTTAPLVSATDRDNATDLYMARIGCPEGEPGCAVSGRVVQSLVQVSTAAHPGEAAEVQGATRLAPDGLRVYFVAKGVLTSAPSPDAQGYGVHGEVVGSNAVAQSAAENLYVYDAETGRTSFIGDLCSGSEVSGADEDAWCPAEAVSDETLWGRDGGEAQTAGVDGRFLVLSTYAQLAAGDTDSAKDVYRYDAVTATLQRVSLGEDGYDANGNGSPVSGPDEGLSQNAFDASIAPGNWDQEQTLQEQYELNNRAVSEDGSRIVFTTSEPLSPAASNGLANVYVWHEGVGGGEGAVSLISSGTSEKPVGQVVISPQGRDIFFVTSQGLVAQDTDGAPDIYDARVGGGFPLTAAERQPCEGDACQGPLTNPAPLLLPGSVSQAPGAGSAVSTPRAGKPKAKVKQRKRRKPAKKHGKAKRSSRRSK